MSLSFVSSAVQTATSDGGFEETKIESKQADEVNKRNAHKPLFEQLRQNQEEEDAKQEEIKQEMMRGTGALDEEDVAHLDALEKQRLGRENGIQQRMHEELALFRAARAERQQVDLEDDNDDDEDETGIPVGISAVVTNARASTTGPSEKNSKSSPVVPKIVVKNRKRRVDPSKKSTATQENIKRTKEAPKKHSKEEVHEPSVPQACLGGLLSGYGSSDDSDR